MTGTSRSGTRPRAATIGERSTRQRIAVAAVLQEVDDFRSAQDLHEVLRQGGQRVGLATVYRSLRAMAEVGEIDVLVTSDGETLYRRCGQGAGHHHHLVCRECGLTIEVTSPSVEQWAAKTAAEHGFSDVQHTLDVFGTCQACVDNAHQTGSSNQG